MSVSGTSPGNSSGNSSDSESAAGRAQPAALADLRVLDLSTPLAEATGRILADLGAEVIKIEPPGGCEARFVPPFNAPSARHANKTELPGGDPAGVSNSPGLAIPNSAGSDAPALPFRLDA